jgi:oxygen-independent coproporphyrinogen-3 oxidase
MTSLLMNTDTRSLHNLLRQSPYASYAYSYPHKTAYRRLEPPQSLHDVWAQEQRDALFLYLHIPFCEMRCGFCNLFTTTNRVLDTETEYLAALKRQALQVADALGDTSFARMAIGGGTPTFLNEEGLHQMFDIAEQVLGADPHNIPISVETSPQTSTTEKLKVLRSRGVDRVSIGVQSFLEEEVHAVGRAQKTSHVEAALTRLREAGFPTLNIDLMYGLPGQTIQSWIFSLQEALRFAPEELYLYPLYVRPLTGIGRRGEVLPLQQAGDIRLECYRLAREFLLANGYRQVSMRMFQATGVTVSSGPVYCCQQDGMVGVGCGARSYTSALHYSTEYAVGASGVRNIIDDYIARPTEAFAQADYGFALDEEEQRRRYLIQSLLQAEGLNFQSYAARFGSHATDDVPQLAELLDCGLAQHDEEMLRLNERGIEYSDVVGPWLGSTRVRHSMSTFDLR